MRGIPLVSPLPERRPVQHPSEIQLPLSKPVATRLPPALVPLVDREFATFVAIADLGPLYTDYHTALADRSHRSALHTPATRRTHLRRTSVLKAPGYHERPRPRPRNRRRAPQDPPTPHPRVPVRLDRGVRRVVRAVEPIPTADRRRRHTDLLDAALRILAVDRRRRPCHGHTAMHTAPSSSIAHLARPPRRRPSIAVQVLRPLRAAGSPWLAGRNSARWIARYSSSPTPTEKAASTPQQSSTITATTPTTPISQRVARQTALDTVTVLAAAETLRVVAAQQSPAIADTMREALHQRGLDVPTNPARRQPNKRTPPPRTAQDTTATPDIPLLD